MKYIREALGQLFPEQNRVAALVAAIRTFRQTLVGGGTIGGGGALIITATDLVQIDWAGLGIGVAAVLLTALLSSSQAFWDVATNGVPAQYARTAIAAEKAEEHLEAELAALSEGAAVVAAPVAVTNVLQSSWPVESAPARTPAERRARRAAALAAQR